MEVNGVNSFESQARDQPGPVADHKTEARARPGPARPVKSPGPVPTLITRWKMYEEQNLNHSLLAGWFDVDTLKFSRFVFQASLKYLYDSVQRKKKHSPLAFFNQKGIFLHQKILVSAKVSFLFIVI